MTDTITKRERPLSPHLQIYKPQITSISSILHRMMGVALTLFLFVLTWGLVALALGRETYETFTVFWTSPIGQVMLVGWTLAFFYHACTGIRHFVLDAGFLFDKDKASLSGFIVIAMAVILTLATWGYIYKDVITGGTL